MNNFIFENATKVYFGKGCVKEYLACLTKQYGDTVMLCYGGGSIKKNGVYEEVMSILTSGNHGKSYLRKGTGRHKAGKRKQCRFVAGRRRRQCDGLLQSNFHCGQI